MPVLCLMDKWESGIAPSKADWEPEDVSWINDAAKPLCLALSPRAAAQLAPDGGGHRSEGQALSDETLAQIVIGQPFNLSRASHWRSTLTTSSYL
jgi:hypothetical protein